MWFEAYLDGGWYTFDSRNHPPRIGRILVACGRAAADVAIGNSFGPSQLCSFKVLTEEVSVLGFQPVFVHAIAQRLSRSAEQSRRGRNIVAGPL